MCRFDIRQAKNRYLRRYLFRCKRANLLFFAGHREERQDDLVKTYDQKPDTDRDWERIDVFRGG